MPRQESYAAGTTPAVQDYVKNLYLLAEEAAARGAGPVIATTQIAERLGVSPASATNMLKRLARLGLVRHGRYKGAELTEPGRKVALEVIRHHRLLETYLAEALGVPWDEVHDEAEILEHVLSEDLEERIAARLGDPTEDPHGHPIPPRDLAVAPQSLVPLSDLVPGQRGTVAEVSDRDPELLRYLGSRGLFPGSAVASLEVEPFDGPITIDVGGERHSIGRAAAREILVADVRGG